MHDTVLCQKIRKTYLQTVLVKLPQPLLTVLTTASSLQHTESAMCTAYPRSVKLWTKVTVQRLLKSNRKSK